MKQNFNPLIGTNLFFIMDNHRRLQDGVLMFKIPSYTSLKTNSEPCKLCKRMNTIK